MFIGFNDWLDNSLKQRATKILIANINRYWKNK